MHQQKNLLRIADGEDNKWKLNEEDHYNRESVTCIFFTWHNCIVSNIKY